MFYVLGLLVCVVNCLVLLCFACCDYCCFSGFGRMLIWLVVCVAMICGGYFVICGFYVFPDLVSCLWVMRYAVCLVLCYVVAYLVTVTSVVLLFFAL